MTMILKGIDDISWEDYIHANGTAEDIPGKLKSIVSCNSDDIKDKLIIQLQETLYFQRMSNSAAPVVMPFLLNIFKSEILHENLQEKLLQLICNLATVGVNVWKSECTHQPFVIFSRFAKEEAQNRRESYKYFSEEYKFYLQLLQKSKKPTLRQYCAHILAWLPQHGANVIPTLWKCYQNEPDKEVKITIFLSVVFLVKLQDEELQKLSIKWIYANKPESHCNGIWSAYTIACIYLEEGCLSQEFHKDVVSLTSEMVREETIWGNMFYLTLRFLLCQSKRDNWDVKPILWDIWDRHLKLHRNNNRTLRITNKNLAESEFFLLSTILDVFFEKSQFQNNGIEWSKQSVEEQKISLACFDAYQIAILKQISLIPSLFDRANKLSCKLSKLCLPNNIVDLICLWGWLPEKKMITSIKEYFNKETAKLLPALETLVATIDFYKMLSLHFPFSKELLTELEDHLDWECISRNPQINFTKELLISFKEKWDWIMLGRNKGIKWDIDLVGAFSDKIVWDDKTGIISRDDIEWNNEMLLMLPEGNAWTFISSNQGVNWTEGLIEKFKDKWNWGCLSSNPSLPWSHSLLKKYSKNWDWKQGLSNNTALPWSEEFYLKYKEIFDPYMISGNEGLPWSEHFIEQCFAKIVWWRFCGLRSFPWTKEWFDKNIDNFNKWKNKSWEVLSENPSLPWSEEFINQYKHYWNWYFLSRNISLPWSVGLIKTYFSKWNWESLMVNPSIKWNDEMIALLLEYVSKNTMNSFLFNKSYNFPWTLKLANNTRLRNVLRTEDFMLYRHVVASNITEELVREICLLKAQITKKEQKKYLKFFQENAPNLDGTHAIYTALDLKMF